MVIPSWRCLYPALEDVVLIWDSGENNTGMPVVEWNCRVHLLGLLRRYRGQLKTLERNIAESPVAFSPDTYDTPFVKSIVWNGKNVHIPKNSMLQIIADELATEAVDDPSFRDIDDLKMFVQTTGTTCSTSRWASRFTGLCEAILFPSQKAEAEDLFEILSAPLGLEGRSKYDWKEWEIVDAMQAMNDHPDDDEPTTGEKPVELSS
ncbi:hypothetical protein OF83DRAFT_1089711 [Amylostereum chailletii]|nr:hypothetical protein OF83DRAFT_1089711 [Amylostereum chailletii]